MPSLWVATPFVETACDMDVRSVIVSAASRRGASARVLSVPNDTAIAGFGLPSSLAFGGSCYTLDNVRCSEGDVLFLVAHGASGKDSRLFSRGRVLRPREINANETNTPPMPMGRVFARLKRAGALKLSKIFFAVCFSALDKHCALGWKSFRYKYKDDAPNDCDIYGIYGLLNSPMLMGPSTFLWINPAFVKVN